MGRGLGGRAAAEGVGDLIWAVVHFSSIVTCVASYAIPEPRLTSLQMFEGKEQRHHLIAELRTTHALQAPEQQLQAREREAIHSKQAHHHQHQHQVCRDT